MYVYIYHYSNECGRKKIIIQMNVDRKKELEKPIFWNIRNVYYCHSTWNSWETNQALASASLSPTFVRPLALTSHHIHTSSFFCKEHNHMHTYLSIYIAIYTLSQ